MYKSFLIIIILILFSEKAFAEPKCIEGNCKNGWGTLKYSNGFKFSGKWKNGFITDFMEIKGKGVYLRGGIKGYGSKEWIEEPDLRVINAGENKNFTIQTVVNIVSWDKLGVNNFVKNEDVKKDFEFVNKVWSQANISFEVKKINFIKINYADLQKDIDIILKEFPFKKKRQFTTQHALDRNVKKKINTYSRLIDIKKHKTEFVDIFYLPPLHINNCGWYNIDPKLVSRQGSQRNADRQNSPIIINSKCTITDEHSSLNFVFHRGKTVSHELGHYLQDKVMHRKKLDYLMSQSGSGIMLHKQDIKKARKFLERN